MVGKTKTFEKGKEKSKTLQALRIRPSGLALTSHIVLNGTNAVALSEDGDTNTSATLLKCHQKEDGTGETWGVDGRIRRSGQSLCMHAGLLVD